MSKKNDRRAAEREARKIAYQQLRQERAQSHSAVAPSLSAEITPAIENPDLLSRAHAFFSTEHEPACEISETSEISEARLTANRANAQLSCGPKTSEGKAKSSLNALKHGLTSQTVVLAGEDTLQYNRKLDIHIERFQPADAEELRLVQSLVDHHWRIHRLLRMETAILLKGQLELAHKFDGNTPAEREGLTLAEIYLKYEKSLRNLNIQEARLRRCLDKDQVELQRLQTIRKRAERQADEAAQSTSRPVPSRPSPRVLNQHGFVFSTAPTSEPPPLSQLAKNQ